MKSIIIKSGHIINPANGINEILDLQIRDNKVFKIAKNIEVNKDDYVLDANNKIVFPGLVDMQVHLRDPGREDKETIDTGLKSALMGGITSVVSMPNTNPVSDNQAAIEYQIKKAKELNLANLFPAGATTIGQNGKKIVEMFDLKKSGAIAFTDDGVDVSNAGVLKKAMEWAKTFDVLIMSHCEEKSIHEGSGVMHEGFYSTKMGLKGVSPVVEDYGVFRSCLLSQEVQNRMHILHCSTKGGLDIIADFKKRNKNLTCETCPQYFALDDSICDNYNTFAKMYPPIRSKNHKNYVIEKLKDDIIDVISTDHAPHLPSDKLQPFEEAAFGSIGLETSFSIGRTFLVNKNHISFSKLIEKMSTNPANILGINRGNIKEGEIADIAIFDPKKEWIVDSSKFHTKGRNCVFEGMKLLGKITDVLVSGEIKIFNGNFV